MARVKEYTLTGIDANASGIAAAQNLVAGTGLTLEAAAAALDPARKIEIDSDADISAVVFTVVGTDRWGRPQSEEITGVTTTAVSSVHIYGSITSITPDTTDAVNSANVGWVAGTISPWVVCGRRVGLEQLPTCKVSFLILEGAADGSVEITYSSNQSPAKASYPHIFEAAEQVIENHPVDETIAITPATPVNAQGVMCRVVMSTGAGTSAKVRFAQPGP